MFLSEEGQDLREQMPMGPYFWYVMVVYPVVAGVAAVYCVQPSEDSHILAAEAFLGAIFGVACLQAPFLARWQKWVEGDVGMPDWVHVQAGVAEVTIVCLRLYGRGASWCWTGSHEEAESAMAINMAHVLTCGMMGGALWTWPFGAQRSIGMIPAMMVLGASTTASWQYLSRPTHFVASSAALVGASVAAQVHRIHTIRKIKRSVTGLK